MKVSLPSKLSKTKQPGERERATQAHVQSHTCTHAHTHTTAVNGSYRLQWRYRKECEKKYWGWGGGGLKIQQHIYSHVRSKYTPAKWQSSMVLVFHSLHLVSCCPVKCDSMSFVSFTLSVKRSHSPCMWRLWTVWPVWLKWLQQVCLCVVWCPQGVLRSGCQGCAQFDRRRVKRILVQWMMYAMLYVRQLNCFVIFIWD